MRHSRIFVALFVPLALAACADLTSSLAVEEDFGNSARSVIQAQTANPATLTAPSTAIVTGVEPDYATNVIKAFREDASKPEKVKQPIVMQVGGWSSSR